MLFFFVVFFRFVSDLLLWEFMVFFLVDWFDLFGFNIGIGLDLVS